MSVSRLDSVKLLTNFALAATTGSATGESPAVYPCNTVVSLHAAGTFGGGTVAMEVTPDGGTTWVPAVTSPASLTAAGVLTWTGAALGVRAKVTGATTPDISAWAVFSDQG